MIRTVIGFFVAAVVLCLYIVLRPASEPEADTTTVDVTRSAVTPTTPVAPVETASNDGGLAPGVAEAIAPAPQVVGSAAAEILAAARAGQLEEKNVKTDNSSIQETTAGVLAALGLDTGAAAAPAPTDSDDPMAAMTANALAGIRAATGQTEVEKPRNELQELVAWALKEGQSDSYIDSLLNEAATSGSVTVPQMLVTSDGRVDTATLLASIVQQATVANGGAAPAVPEVPLGESDGVEVRVVQRAEGTEQFRFYTVASGDSLGSIAVKFYGSVEHYPAIFEANRAKLSSPDQIQAGQRLVIPEL